MARRCQDLDTLKINPIYKTGSNPLIYSGQALSVPRSGIALGLSGQAGLLFRPGWTVDDYYNLEVILKRYIKREVK